MNRSPRFSIESVPVDGTGLFAIFLVDAGATLEFDDVTLTNATGAALFNSGGKITLNSSTVSFCAGFRPLGGGGIFNATGTVTLNSSTVAGNTATSGAGIYNPGGTLILMTRLSVPCPALLRSKTTSRILSAGGVADEWLTQLLRQGDAKVFKKYSQMKLQMKREALQKPNRKAN